MKAVIVASTGAAAEVQSDIEAPVPNDTQLLVKCVYTAINPVDAFMANMGLLVESWPLVPGCDGAGVVVKAGKDAESALGGKFKEGDEVFGCTRLGQKGHGAWQEYVCWQSHTQHLLLV
jgi:NADPH:quinone reductase-like Zn-dependent oxidoreductase